jgi:peptidoglycan/xylan/chitin deacetylase (PgdA/CDA1 family)
VTGVVLLYHRVASPPRDLHGLAVAPDAFRAHMSWLRSHCTSVALDTLVAPLTGLAGHAARVAEGSNVVAVTLDDGYVDNFTDASPILQDFEIPATFFVTTERLEDPCYEQWWDRLERMITTAPPTAGDLRVDAGDGPVNYATGEADSRLESYRRLHRAIAHAPIDLRKSVLAAVASWAGESGSGDRRTRRMHADEMQALASRSGHSLGAHSESHPFLPAQSADVQRQEIERSMRAVERLLGRVPAAFAYPFGGVEHETADIVREAGFVAAVTTEEAPVTGRTNPWRVPRFEVTGERAVHFGSWMESLFNGR